MMTQLIIALFIVLKFVKDSVSHKNISKTKRRDLYFPQLTDFVPALPSYRNQSIDLL